jgi:predicted short-subunit dehydrogenase-like oxidoreductase (DUF2520 family)
MHEPPDILDAALMPVRIAGTGRAGTAVGLALRDGGISIRFMSRSNAGPIDGIPVLGPGDKSPPLVPTITILAVPDAAISAALEDLVHRDLLGPDPVIGHLSGSMTSSGLTGAGFDGFSAHPLFSFPPANARRRMPEGTSVLIEGSIRGAAVATSIFRCARAATAQVDPALKTRVHAAAVIAANLPAVLLWSSAGLLESAGVPDPVTVAARLVRSMADNHIDFPATSSITGPMVRGDLATIRSNLEALDSAGTEPAALYRETGRRLASLLHDTGRIDDRTCRQILEVLG